MGKFLPLCLSHHNLNIGKFRIIDSNNSEDSNDDKYSDVLSLLNYLECAREERTKILERTDFFQPTVNSQSLERKVVVDLIMYTSFKLVQMEYTK